MKRIVLCTVLLISFIVAGMSQDLRFTGQYLYQSPVSRIFAVTSGDLDKDGRKDIVFTEPDRPLLQWLKNEGSGQFSLHTVGSFPAIGALVVDFNNDGNMDIVACSYDLNLVVVFFNDGNGNFAMDTLSAAVQHPLVLSAGDLDGDGDKDIAVATQDAGTGAVLLINQGNLNFTVQQLDAQAYSCTWVEIVDLDKDTIPDVVAVNFTPGGGLVWYDQTSTLTFTKHTISFPNAHGAAIGDLDGDGDLDLAAVSCGSSVAWLENDGNNNFTVHPVFTVYNCAVSVGIRDIDKDSKNDIAAVAWGSSRVDWFKNDGNQSFTRYTICDTLQNPSDLCISDLGNDGFPDILTGSYAKKLAWFENTGQHVTAGSPVVTEPFVLVSDPRNRQVILKWNGASGKTKKIEVYNLQGDTLLSILSQTDDEPVHIKSPSSGVFLLKIRIGGDLYIKKIAL